MNGKRLTFILDASYFKITKRTEDLISQADSGNPNIPSYKDSLNHLGYASTGKD